jgi:hypothetical protein
MIMYDFFVTFKRYSIIFFFHIIIEEVERALVALPDFKSGAPG